MALVSDTGSQYTFNARPNEGYHSYKRTLVFSHDTDRAYVDGFIAGLKASKIDMWFRSTIEVDDVGQVHVLINHGFDSGD